jgi:hypothetical protein
MKAYQVKEGATMWVFTEASAVLSKGRRLIAKGDLMFTEIVMDPIRMANGQRLDPEMYLDGFASVVDSAVRNGYFVFRMDPYGENPEEMVAIAHNDLKLAGENRSVWGW